MPGKRFPIKLAVVGTLAGAVLMHVAASDNSPNIGFSQWNIPVTTEQIIEQAVRHWNQSEMANMDAALDEATPGSMPFPLMNRAVRVLAQSAVGGQNWTWVGEYQLANATLSNEEQPLSGELRLQTDVNKLKLHLKLHSEESLTQAQANYDTKLQGDLLLTAHGWQLQLDNKKGKAQYIPIKIKQLDNALKMTFINNDQEWTTVWARGNS